jgi:hypothetical protein
LVLDVMGHDAKTELPTSLDRCTMLLQGIFMRTGMTDIQYRIGDATAPTTDGNKFIAHICNDIGGWGKGFVLAISKR